MEYSLLDPLLKHLQFHDICKMEDHSEAESQDGRTVTTCNLRFTRSEDFEDSASYSVPIFPIPQTTHKHRGRKERGRSRGQLLMVVVAGSRFGETAGEWREGNQVSINATAVEMVPQSIQLVSKVDIQIPIAAARRARI